MRVLLLALSDIHFKNEEDIIDKKIDKLIKSLSGLSYERVCIIISGDIAQSAKVEEYTIAKKFLGKLISKLAINDIGFIETIIVPGNHDIDLTNSSLTGKVVDDLYKSGNLLKLNNEQIQRMKNFFEFSKSKKCFVKEKIIDSKIYFAGDHRIKFNLINTCLFSMRENDKGFHYIPESELSKISVCDEDEITITIMHHSPSWFLPDLSNKLEKIIHNNSSIVFIGHEHDNTMKSSSLMNGFDSDYICGGVFCDRLNSNRSEFYSVVLDTQNKTYDSYFHEWNKDRSFYMVKQQVLNKSIGKIHIEPKKTFIDYFVKADIKNQISDTFENYYVFPTFDIIDNEQGAIGVLKDFDSLLSLLEIRKKMLIYGDEDCGKTTNMKMLYLSALKKFKYCLLLDTDDLNNKRFDKMIQNAFEEQYSELYEEFQLYSQANKESKAIFIDNIQMVNKHTIRDFVDYLTEKFEYVVLTSKNDWDFDLKSIANKKIHVFNDFTTLKINKFYSDKRKDLIRKVISLNKYIINYDIDRVVQEINEIIQKNLNYFDLSPYFIIQYAVFVSQNKLSGVKDNKLFSSVFESNLKRNIDLGTDGSNVDATISALSRIAYHVHFKEEYPISRQSISLVLKEYTQKYDQDLNSNNFIQSLIKARVLTEVDCEFLRFTSLSYLSFFAAREIIRLHNQNGNYEDIRHIFTNLCFNINADIAFFISYLTQNSNILDYIFDSAKAFITDWSLFDFNMNKYKSLNEFLCTLEIEAPKEDEVKQLKHGEVELEKELNQMQLITNDIYDYNAEDVTKIVNQLIIAIKYSEIISRILPSFDHEIEIGKKMKYVEATYNLPNSIIHKFLDYLNEDFELQFSELVEFYKDEENYNDDNAKMEVKKFITHIITSLIPGIYKSIAINCIDSNTIKHYQKYTAKNDAERTMNVIIQETAHQKDEFTYSLVSLYNKTTNSLVKTVMQKIAKYHIMTTTYISQSNIDKLDSVFSLETRKQLLIERYKKKSN